MPCCAIFLRGPIKEKLKRQKKCAFRTGLKAHLSGERPGRGALDGGAPNLGRVFHDPFQFLLSVFL